MSDVESLRLVGRHKGCPFLDYNTWRSRQSRLAKAVKCITLPDEPEKGGSSKNDNSIQQKRQRREHQSISEQVKTERNRFASRGRLC